MINLNVIFFYIYKYKIHAHFVPSIKNFGIPVITVTVYSLKLKMVFRVRL